MNFQMLGSRFPAAMNEWQHQEAHKVPRWKYETQKCVINQDFAFVEDELRGEQGIGSAELLHAVNISAWVRALTGEVLSAAARQEREQLRERAEELAFKAIGEVVGITTELFGKAQIMEDYDPEYPDEKYVVFVVEASDDIDDILAKEATWVSRVRQLAKRWHNMRLSIIAK